MPASHTAVPDRFQATHWSLLVRAAEIQEPGRSEALETLCREYWKPIHGYIVSRGFAEADAKDLTQAFLLRLISGNALQQLDPTRGRFRSFLLAAIKRFLTDEWRKGSAAKRGGQQAILSIEAQEYGSRGPAELSSAAADDAVFDKQWALTLIDRAISQLRTRWSERGKLPVFDALRDYLGGSEPTAGYEDAAARLGLSLEAVKTHIHRLRKEYREILRQEIAGTVNDPTEIDLELRYLCKALAA